VGASETCKKPPVHAERKSGNFSMQAKRRASRLNCCCCQCAKAPQW